MKTKEWLLLNAIECWLYYCDEKLELTSSYKTLRDEYSALVAALDNKDAVEDEAAKPSRTPRSRIANSKK